MHKQTIISITFGVLIFLFTVVVSVNAVWNPPTVAPPGGNVDAPVNLGATLQHKAGVLQVDGLRSFGGFTTGTGVFFDVSSTGDLIRIKDVPYVWPSANAVGVLTSDILGNLSWAAAAGGGDITGVTAGLGLTGGGLSGDVTLINTGDTTADNIADDNTITDLEASDALTIGSTGSVTWSALASYPATCGVGNAVQTIGDTLTCVAVGGGGGGGWTDDGTVVRLTTSTDNVGIGTASPARKLHVTDVMRLQPRATAPSSPVVGDIYFDSTDVGALCVYLSSGWESTTGGGGSCS